MKTVKVEKIGLKRALEQNLRKHRSDFEDALEGYKKRAVELLEEHIERIRNGKVEEVYVQLPRPVDHTPEYKRALAMVGASVDDQIELSKDEFAQLWLDDWSWKREFLETSRMYTQRR
ncbi:MAG: hypothetical protein GY937_19985 [bacterium]|nr:hypothetical protein [bacterium]